MGEDNKKPGRTIARGRSPAARHADTGDGGSAQQCSKETMFRNQEADLTVLLTPPAGGWWWTTPTLVQGGCAGWWCHKPKNAGEINIKPAPERRPTSHHLTIPCQGANVAERCTW